MKKKPKGYYTEGKGDNREVHPLFEPKGLRIPHSKSVHATRDQVYDLHMKERTDIAYLRKFSLSTMIEQERHLVELTSRKAYEKVRKEKEREALTPTKYQSNKEIRKGWILERWLWLNRGAIDFGKNAKRLPVEAYPRTNASFQRNSGARGKQDLVGLDHPRKDIDRLETKGKRLCYVGGTNRKNRIALKAVAKDVLENNFTREEIDAMHGVYFEASPPSSRFAAASNTCARIPYYPIGSGNVERRNITTVDPKYCDEETVTHELVHARRHGMGEHIDSRMDHDREETETELETMARVRHLKPSPMTGYYHRCGGWDDKKYDRLQLTGSLDKGLRGKKARQKVKEYYPKSKISTVHFSPEENLDRYFLIEVGGLQMYHHMKFKSPPKRTDVLSDLKKDFGEDIKVWEYRDGKKVRYYSRNND